MTTASTGAPVAHTLNPAIFLAEFIDLGGGYCLTPDNQLCLGVLHGSDGEQDGVKVLEAIQRLTPADKDVIKAHLAGGGGAASRAQIWGEAMTHYEVTQRNYAEMRKREQAGETIGRDEDNRISGAFFDADTDLLMLRAPNRAALMWKLERLLACPGGALDPWTSELVAPTMEDLRAFLIGDGSLDGVSNPGGMAPASIDEGKPEGDAAMNMMSKIAEERTEPEICREVDRESLDGILCHAADPVWRELAADLRAKFATWAATINLEQDALDSFDAAAAGLPPEPKKPGFAVDGDILDKTLRELRNASEAAECIAKWAEYEREHAAWKVQRDTLLSQIAAPGKAEYDRTHALYEDALNALMSYPTNNLRDLREKIEIIMADYEGSPIPHEYVRDILGDVSRLAGEASDPFARWNAAMARFEAAKAEADECVHLADVGDATALERLDELADTESDRRWDVINTPAPDLAALRWKLDYVLEGDGGNYTQSLNLARLQQLFADMTRLMGEA